MNFDGKNADGGGIGPAIPARGAWAHFGYVDAGADAAERHLALWEKCDDYVVGFDLTEKAVRSFRIEGISGWTCG